MLHLFSPKRVSATDKLRRHWASQSSPTFRVSSGLSEEALRSFELAHGVVLPADFASYLTAFNGFRKPDDPWSWDALDDEAFDFYSLSDLTASHAGSKYYVFCYWELGLLPYAICLDPLGPVGLVVSVREDLRRCASSFSDFVDLYVSNSMPLYESGSKVAVVARAT